MSTAHTTATTPSQNGSAAVSTNGTALAPTNGTPAAIVGDDGAALTPVGATARAATGAVLAKAREYVAGGVSVIPVGLDGAKQPAFKLLPKECNDKGEWVSVWKPYTRRLPNDEELVKWVGGKQPCGIATLSGKISGSMELIDFDNPNVYQPWCEAVEAIAPGLVERLSRSRTPGGWHVRYRCPDVEIPTNQKLAMEYVLDASGNVDIDPRTGRLKDEVLIETRGERGYAVAPGSPRACNPAGIYEHVAGPPPSNPPEITAAERQMLFDTARSFNKVVDELTTMREASRVEVGGLRPGDDFNRRGWSWEELLPDWTVTQRTGTGLRLRRPGKEDPGHSATAGYCKSKEGYEYLYVFSSNASPFTIPSGRMGGAYTKFQVYALIHHGGDFKAAAKALRALGFGAPGGGAGRGAEPAVASAAPAKKAPTKTFEVAGLTLMPETPRRTDSGKLVVRTKVLRDCATLDTVGLSETVSTRKGVIKLLALHAGVADEDADAKRKIEAAIGAVLAWAGEELAASAGAKGVTVHDVVNELIPPMFGFTHRVDRAGAWSEVRKADVLRGDFLASATTTELLARAAEAIDAPRTHAGHVNRAQLLRAVEAELKVYWADLVKKLPFLNDADLGKDSGPSVVFRAQIGKLLTKLHTFEVLRDKGGCGPEFAERASLLSLVKTQWGDPELCAAADKGWVRIRRAVSCWWRLAEGVDGKVHAFVGIRWELASQLQVELPGVHDQASLTRLGTKFGVLEKDPRVTPVLSKGKARLAVVSPEITDELMDDPMET
jgi:putative DNA primase/helicase